MKVGREIVSMKSRRSEPVPAILQKRQREVNEKVVGWMSGGKSLAGTLTVDACAGPEGSLWAIHHRKGEWIGIEVSEADFALLKDNVDNLQSQKFQAIKGDAHQLALDSQSADYYLFVLALNHLRVKEAMKEAVRIINRTGRLVIADTGPTFWLIDVVLYCALSQIAKGPAKSKEAKCAEQLLNSRHRLRSNIDYFCDRVLNSSAIGLLEYGKYLLTQNFGRRKTEEYFQEIAKTLKPGQINQRNWWHERGRALDADYWDNLIRALNHDGLALTRMGVMAAVEIKTKSGEKKWEVGEVNDCEIDVANLYQSQARKLIARQRPATAGESTGKRLFIRCLLARA